MLYDLIEKLGKNLIINGKPVRGLALCIVFLVSFLFVFFTIKIFRKILPKDQGREFAVNGELSQGKARGAGLIFITGFVILTALFIPLDLEKVLYLVFIYGAMLSGYLDDASDVPWGEVKKGLIDLVISGGIAGTYYYFNSGKFKLPFLKVVIEPHPAVFIILAAILVWAAINVTNCSDGVDGLCATLCMVTIFFVSRFLEDSAMITACLIMLAALGAYLWSNSSPSSILMGDAGSRALGVFLAVICLKTGSPLIFIPLAIVLIIDGGLGLVKLSFIRFLRLKNFMKNIRTPIHDHVRKNKGWSDTQVVARFVIIQILVAACFCFITE
ncbi:MAG: phospho-N-acetylmuramoyl-pentapeptide-transferase [Ruminococcus sp.]|nr:phospho-N-acetylmuramoyl-pentapeptide-transferase [Ruminococcus sp.]